LLNPKKVVVTMNGKLDSQYHVPNLERALEIMELLSSRPGGVGMAEIAKLMNYPANSVFRILSTLEERGYVLREPESKKYSLSRKLLALGYQALDETGLVEIAVDALRRLRDETGETALLGVLLDGEGVVLDQMPSPQPIKFIVNPGTRFPLHTAAPGKAMLAYLPEDERERQIGRIKFTRFNDQTIADADALRRELDNVRRRGYAFDLGEEEESLFCTGAAILDYRGYPRAALWVTGPAFRLTKEKLKTVGETAQRLAGECSARLGYQNGTGKASAANRKKG